VVPALSVYVDRVEVRRLVKSVTKNKRDRYRPRSTGLPESHQGFRKKPFSVLVRSGRRPECQARLLNPAAMAFSAKSRMRAWCDRGKPCHHQYVAGVQLVEQSAKLRPDVRIGGMTPG
jgi:hypothetical protein